MSLEDELRTTPYAFVAKLAEGGMGELCVVRHRELGDLAAMKLLKDDLSEHRQALTERLRAEGRMLRALAHENLVRVLDFGFSARGRPYLVTELLEGRSLKAELALREVLPLGEVLEIAKQVLLGLEVVHAAGLVHRDIKPDNLFYCAQAEGGGNGGWRIVKLLDFGIAKILEDQGRFGALAPTATGISVGTPLYFAPEQARAQPVDARTDLYGLGGVLLHLATGLPPFVRRRADDLFVAHLSEPPERPSARRPELPRAFDELVLRALAKDPAARFASAADMLLAVDSVSVLARRSALPAAPQRTPKPAPAREPGPAAEQRPYPSERPRPAREEVDPEQVAEERTSLRLGVAVAVVALVVLALLLAR